MQDAILAFFEKYATSDPLGAIEQICGQPNQPYNTLRAGDPEILDAVVNYADAASHATLFDVWLTNINLQNVLVKKKLDVLFSQVVSILKYEKTLLQTADSPEEILAKFKATPLSISGILNDMRDKKIIPADEIQNAIYKTPHFYKATFENALTLSQAVARLKNEKPDIFKVLFETANRLLHPWYLLRYKIALTPLVLAPSGDIPLIFLEPYDGNWNDFLSDFKGKRAIFVFENKGMLSQMLSMPNVQESLLAPEHFIYIMDAYPNEQFLVQGWQSTPGLRFQPILTGPKPMLEEALPILQEALQACLTQNKSELASDSPEGNWLFHAAKRYLFRTREQKLGEQRAAALIEHTHTYAWHSPHKGLPPPTAPLGPPPADYFGQHLQKLALHRHVIRPFLKKDKIRLAHIVPQVIEGGHAPTRLLENLLSFASLKRYELTVIVSERMYPHPMEYPFGAVSASSMSRAANFLQFFNNLGVKIHVLNNPPSYEESAKSIAHTLSALNIDVAIFHSPDVINTMCAQITDCPLRVMFEHGTPPLYPGYDIAILSTEAALGVYQSRLEAIGTKGYALPFALDVRRGWPTLPLMRQEYGLPEKGFIMTTISNSLENRLGKEMRYAIAEILKRNPNAYYAPMGTIHDLEAFMNSFAALGVREKIIPLGSRKNPSNIARNMQLYLNEFPFGSCLGILDAMASGVPVVSMYDPEGPQQARYGGAFFGFDRTVPIGDIEGYIQLASRLIQDKTLYSEWSAHALQCYNKFADVGTYVAKFQSIIELELESKQKN